MHPRCLSGGHTSRLPETVKERSHIAEGHSKTSTSHVAESSTQVAELAAAFKEVPYHLQSHKPPHPRAN